MKLTYCCKTASAACFALFAVAGVFAQEEESAEKKEGPKEESAEAAPAESAPAKDAATFTTLIRCYRAEGAVEVLKPGASGWSAVEEGRFYPVGSSFRADFAEGKAPLAVFQFGPEASMTMTNAAEVSTVEAPYGAPSRTVRLVRGRVMFTLPRTLKDGLFSVAAPFFAASNLAGSSVFDYMPAGDGDEAVVRCVTGSLALEGRHYKIARMGVANQVRIRTTGDDLFTSLRGESGDCKMTLAQGTVAQKDFETGEVKTTEKTLEFVLSPKCAVKIFRAKVPSSGRMAVSTMTFDATGAMKNRCAFAEGLAGVNSGELVVEPKPEETDEGDGKKKDAAKAKKQGAEGDKEEAASEGQTEEEGGEKKKKEEDDL